MINRQKLIGMSGATVLAASMIIGLPYASDSFGETRPAKHDKHEGHDHDKEKHDEHEGHDHDEEKHDEHEGHDHDKEKHDEHEGHGHGDEDIVKLSAAELKEFRIKLEKAKAGVLYTQMVLPGVVKLHADRVAHITPRSGGIVRRVFFKLGDKVKKGQAMATLISRELAQSKTTYLSKLERLSLADTIFKREELLWKVKKITSLQEFLVAKSAYTEARIELKDAENQLRMLGYATADIQALPEEDPDSYAFLEIIAPRDGVIIEKHVTLGEVVKEDANLFTLADLSEVWVDLNVYPKDLHLVKKGSLVRIASRTNDDTRMGKIAYVSPMIDQHTRTAFVRIELNNAKGHWRPGLFVTGEIVTKRAQVKLMVSKLAIQMVEGKQSVFVKTAKGFEPKAVKLGRRSATHIEILSGLKAGVVYVSKGSFTLKSELGKGDLGHAGHAH